jgi:hypothetical protein
LLYISIQLSSKQFVSVSPKIVEVLMPPANLWRGQTASSVSLDWAGATPTHFLGGSEHKNRGRSSPARCFARAQISLRFACNFFLFCVCLRLSVNRTVNGQVICVFHAPFTSSFGSDHRKIDVQYVYYQGALSEEKSKKQFQGIRRFRSHKASEPAILVRSSRTQVVQTWERR